MVKRRRGRPKGSAHINTVAGLKWCPRCQERKGVDQFGSDVSRNDGLTGWCRHCRAEKETKRRRITERPARERHQQQFNAKAAIRYAVKTGRIVPPAACMDCLLVRPLDAHHHLGYAKENWLRVVWLCRSCHCIAHRRSVKA